MQNCLAGYTLSPNAPKTKAMILSSRPVPINLLNQQSSIRYVVKKLSGLKLKYLGVILDRRLGTFKRPLRVYLHTYT